MKQISTRNKCPELVDIFCIWHQIVFDKNRQFKCSREYKTIHCFQYYFTSQYCMSETEHESLRYKENTTHSIVKSTLLLPLEFLPISIRNVWATCSKFNLREIVDNFFLWDTQVKLVSGFVLLFKVNRIWDFKKWKRESESLASTSSVNLQDIKLEKRFRFYRHVSPWICPRDSYVPFRIHMLATLILHIINK